MDASISHEALGQKPFLESTSPNPSGPQAVCLWHFLSRKNRASGDSEESHTWERQSSVSPSEALHGVKVIRDPTLGVSRLGSPSGRSTSTRAPPTPVLVSPAVHSYEKYQVHLFPPVGCDDSAGSSSTSTSSWRCSSVSLHPPVTLSHWAVHSDSVEEQGSLGL